MSLVLSTVSLEQKVEKFSATPMKQVGWVGRAIGPYNSLPVSGAGCADAGT
jgi:hypothetical protein